MVLMRMKNFYLKARMAMTNSNKELILLKQASGMVKNCLKKGKMDTMNNKRELKLLKVGIEIT